MDENEEINISEIFNATSAAMKVKTYDIQILRLNNSGVIQENLWEITAFQ